MANDDPLTQVDTQYGQFFANFLRSAAKGLHGFLFKYDALRGGRTGINLGFRENDLRNSVKYLHKATAECLRGFLFKYGTLRDGRTGIGLGFRENDLRNAVKSLHKAAPGGSVLLVEQKLSGDVTTKGKKVGRADYVLVKRGSRVPPPLTNVLATCEVKGPTRAAFLDPDSFRRNWALRGLIDVKKQMARARAAPAAEHHVAFLIPFTKSHVLERIRTAFVNQALHRLPNATMNRSGIASVKLADHHDLIVIVFRVGCKGSSAGS
jgi:hypothetical protein